MNSKNENPSGKSETKSRQDYISLFFDMYEKLAEMQTEFELASPGDDWWKLSDTQGMALPDMNTDIISGFYDEMDFAYFKEGLGLGSLEDTFPLALETMHEDNSPDGESTGKITENSKTLAKQSAKEDTFGKYINFRFFCTRELSGQKALDFNGETFKFDDNLIRPLLQMSETDMDNEAQPLPGVMF